MSYVPSTITPAAALSKVMDDRVATTRLTSARLLANLANNGRIATARKQNLDWAVDLAGEAAGVGLLVDNTVNTAGAKTVAANLRIGAHRVYHRFNISRLDLQEAQQIAPEELQNLFGAVIDRGLNALVRRINQLLYTGVGSDATAGVIGLNAVLDNTAAYAGINPATAGNSEWTATVLQLTAPFDRDAMLEMDEIAAIRETFYDMVVMHPSKARDYQSMFDTLASQYSLVNQAEASGLKRADLGHGGRFYNGFPIIEDPQASTDRIYLASAQDVTLHCFELAQGPGNAISEIVINRAYGLPIHIAELPSGNSAIRTFELYVIPQLQVFNRKSLMAIVDDATP